MKLTIATCMHMRPKVSELFLMRCEGLKEYALTKGIDIDLAIVASEGDHETHAMLQRRFIPFVIHNNNHLGAKWNKAIELAIDTEPYAVVICGDDDLLLNSWVDAIYERFSIEARGVNSAYVLGQRGEAGILNYNKNKVIGSGTVIQCDLLKYIAKLTRVTTWLQHTGTHIDGSPYLNPTLAKYLEGINFIKAGETIVGLWPPDLKESFDLIRDMKFAEAGYLPHMIETPEPTIICIKSERSIRTWEYMKRVRWVTDCPAHLPKDLMSAEEFEFWDKNIKLN